MVVIYGLSPAMTAVQRFRTHLRLPLFLDGRQLGVGVRVAEIDQDVVLRAQPWTHVDQTKQGAARVRVHIRVCV